MEDSHICIDMPDLEDHLFVGVFDGHGGAGASLFTVAEGVDTNLVAHIVKTDEWQSYVVQIGQGDGGTSASIETLKNAIVEGFKNFDETLRIHQSETGRGCEDTSGSTAVTAIVTPWHILCANCGDSRCILLATGGVKAMSFDHKPDHPAERARIEAAGAFVEGSRVNAQLAVSRGFGDFEFKSRDLRPADQAVTCHPEFQVHERSAEDRGLLLACDGVWDVMSNEEAAEALVGIVDRLRERRQIGVEATSDSVVPGGSAAVGGSGGGGRDEGLTIVAAADQLVDMALAKGSRDNISALIVAFCGL